MAWAQKDMFLGLWLKSRPKCDLKKFRSLSRSVISETGTSQMVATSVVMLSKSFSERVSSKLYFFNSAIRSFSFSGNLGKIIKVFQLRFVCGYKYRSIKFFGKPI